MKTGLGLPIDPSTDLFTWARSVDASPFTTLALADRLVYDNPDTLLTLTAVAAATSRIRVQSEVLLAPNYNTAILAKQTATLDRLSGGRFTLGVGVGVREDDFLAAGVDVRQRGSRLNQQMEALRRTWAGEPYAEGIGPVGPPPVTPGGPEVLFGGFVPAMIDRVGRWGDGFLGAGLPAEGMDALFRNVEKAWEKHGRSGRPRLVAQANAALGDASVIADAQANIRRYYSGVGLADQQAAGMLTTEKAIRDAVAAFDGIGADELILYCWATDPEQIGRFAEVVFG